MPLKNEVLARCFSLTWGVLGTERIIFWKTLELDLSLLQVNRKKEGATSSLSCSFKELRCWLCLRVFCNLIVGFHTVESGSTFESEGRDGHLDDLENLCTLQLAVREGCEAALEAPVLVTLPSVPVPLLPGSGSNKPLRPSPAQWQASYTRSYRSVLEKQPCGCLHTCLRHICAGQRANFCLFKGKGFNTSYSPEKPKWGLAAQIKYQVCEKNPQLLFLPYIKPHWVQD